MSKYQNVVGGRLKLKGKALDVKEGGVKKKKKKQECEESSQIGHELCEGFCLSCLHCNGKQIGSCWAPCSMCGVEEPNWCLYCLTCLLIVIFW